MYHRGLLRYVLVDTGMSCACFHIYHSWYGRKTLKTLPPYLDLKSRLCARQNIGIGTSGWHSFGPEQLLLCPNSACTASPNLGLFHVVFVHQAELLSRTQGWRTALELGKKAEAVVGAAGHCLSAAHHADPSSDIILCIQVLKLNIKYIKTVQYSF